MTGARAALRAAVLSAALLLAIPAAPAAGAPPEPPQSVAAAPVVEVTPEPEPTTNGPAVPPAIAVFLAQDLPAALRAESAASLGSLTGTVDGLTAGPPRQQWTWSRERLQGDATAPLLVETGAWVAPLLAAGVPVGSVVVGTSGDDARIVLSDVSDDAGAAREIMGLDPAQPAIVDESSGGWFAVEDGRVRALDHIARNLLAGSVPVEDYLPIVAARTVSADPTPEGTPARGSVPWAPLIAVALLVAVLATTFLVVWFKRPDDDAEDEEPATPSGLHELRRPTHLRRRRAATRTASGTAIGDGAGTSGGPGSGSGPGSAQSTGPGAGQGAGQGVAPR